MQYAHNCTIFFYVVVAKTAKLFLSWAANVNNSNLNQFECPKTTPHPFAFKKPACLVLLTCFLSKYI
ncbi:hypothetical protein BVG80_00635 [Sphingobacteriales bacterium TSM_CSM]|nr:hypothetical protein BVG80_00635 [Sphingobacteriales bacterium TSM_CSM]